VPNHKVAIAVDQPFDLKLSLFGHGWIALLPHRFDESDQQWHTVLRLGRSIADASIQQTSAHQLQIRLATRTKLNRTQLNQARLQIAHMLRLGEDLSPFYKMCRRDPSRRWIAKRGGGRLLRSPSVFEDLMKLLFTTNTSWTATEHMTSNLVAAIGPKSPGGAKAFPTPKQCALDESFYRDVVRCGYRSQAALELSNGFAEGRLTDQTFLNPQSADSLWQKLCELRGFGPYAAGQAMRLCGHYNRLAIDSWCRNKLAGPGDQNKPPSDHEIERRYAAMAPYQGLALWCDLTADWHQAHGS
jgi:3-methyladenine DNA glycosylase/8-oxoguanine DNA glycosylase